MEQNTSAFNVIEDGFAVIWIRGEYKQVALYEREEATPRGEVKSFLYAKKGSGFVKIYNDGKTSMSSVFCKGINCQGVIWELDNFGYLERRK